MAVADFYATFGALTGYDPVDPKAERAGLPPPDSVNMLPYILGEVSQSPRTELCLSSNMSGAVTEAQPSSSGLIQTVNGTDFKLIRG